MKVYKKQIRPIAKGAAWTTFKADNRPLSDWIDVDDNEDLIEKELQTKWTDEEMYKAVNDNMVTLGFEYRYVPVFEEKNNAQYLKRMFEKLKLSRKITYTQYVNLVSILDGFEYLVRVDERLKTIADISKEAKKEATILCNDTGVTNYHEYAISLSDFEKIIINLLKNIRELR